MRDPARPHFETTATIDAGYSGRMPTRASMYLGCLWSLLFSTPAVAEPPDCKGYEAISAAANKAYWEQLDAFAGKPLASLRVGGEVQLKGESQIMAGYRCQDECGPRLQPSDFLGWVLAFKSVAVGTITTDGGVFGGIGSQKVVLVRAREGERAVANALKARRRAGDDLAQCSVWGSGEVLGLLPVRAARQQANYD
jgi:hypothetical protein